MSEGDGQPEWQRGCKGDDQMASVTISQCDNQSRVPVRVTNSQRDGQRGGKGDDQQEQRA